ncbi:hypothetical protein, partial [Mucilaginibacter sp.]|uniref:hypothetical protein n=1 Tax=Mucilaginibacter sp. TaxID=1882438 RepID=UPI0026072CBB
MAYSKCPKCENAFFELVENSPSKSNYKLLFVQCSKCGSAIGTMDYYNIGTLVKGVEAKVDKLEKNLPNANLINNNFNTINQNIDALYRLV